MSQTGTSRILMCQKDLLGKKNNLPDNLYIDLFNVDLLKVFRLEMPQIQVLSHLDLSHGSTSRSTNAFQLMILYLHQKLSFRYY